MWKQTVITAAVVSACASMSGMAWAEPLIIDNEKINLDGGEYSDVDGLEANEGVISVINSGQLTNSKPMTVSSAGDDVDAIQVMDAGSSLELNDSTLSTAGNNAVALYLTSGATATVSDTNMNTTGIGSQGVSVGDGVDFKMMRGTVTTSGANADGVAIVGDDALASIDGTEITVTGNGSSAINVANGFAAVDGSFLKSTGDFSNGIELRQAGRAALTNAVIESNGTGSTAIHLINASTLDATNVTLSTTGSDGATVELRDDARAQIRYSMIKSTGASAAGLISGDRSFVDMTYLTIATKGKDAMGIFATDDSRIEADKLNVSTMGSGADGIVLTQGATAQIRNSIIDTMGASSRGLVADAGKVDLINTTVLTKGADAAALSARGATLHVSGGSVHSDQGAALQATQSDVDTMFELRDGASATSGTNVLFDVINADATGKVALQLDSGAYGVGNINGPNDATGAAAIVDVGLSGGALWQGATQAVAQLSMQDSQWNMTASSHVGALHLDGGRVVFVRDGNLKTLTLDSLSGSGQFDMAIDPSTAQADQVNVTGDASGNYTLLVRSSGVELSGTGLNGNDSAKLVQTASGDANFALSNQGGVIDAGSYQYVLARQEGDVAGANEWLLRRNGKASAPTNAGINMADVGLLSATMENTALSGRLSQLRQGDKSAQAWGGTYGLRQHIDNGGTQPYKLNTNGVQFGVDRQISLEDSTLYVGLVGSYTQLKADLGNGSTGKTNSVGAGVYASWAGDHGLYVDASVKLNAFNNQFDARSSDGRMTHGSFSTPGLGLSVAIGRRVEFGDNWFVTPQAQIGMMKVRAVDYTTDNGMNFHIGDATSLTMRAGATLGRTLKLSASRSIAPYVQFATMTESGGRTQVLSNGNAFSSDLNDRRFELGAGVTANLGESNRVDFQLTSAYGHKVSQPWGIAANYSFSW